jgi:hypothetical protein
LENLLQPLLLLGAHVHDRFAIAGQIPQRPDRRGRQQAGPARRPRCRSCGPRRSSHGGRCTTTTLGPDPPGRNTLVSNMLWWPPSLRWSTS